MCITTHIYLSCVFTETHIYLSYVFTETYKWQLLFESKIMTGQGCNELELILLVKEKN